MKTIAFFNNKGGVGKTTLVYHLAWMFQALGLKVMLVDLDPQANLTSVMLDEDRLEDLYDREPPRSILQAIQPLMDRLGDLAAAPVEDISGIRLIPGDPALNLFEERLSEAWIRCLDDNRASREDALRVTTAFHRMIQQAGAETGADVALLDVGPSLGALNRAALVATDYVVVPLAADLFSIRGLRNLGPTLGDWRTGWRTRRERSQAPNLPSGRMKPIGYVVLSHATQHRRPVKAFARWIARIPETYALSMLEKPGAGVSPEADPNRLATLKYYMSLMPLAHDARKPVFLLKPADGALGSHGAAVQSAYHDFEALARKIAVRCRIALPLDV